VALQAVPEPPGLLLAGTALLALLLLRRKYATASAYSRHGRISG
jgi:hypothetical protein